MSSTSDDDLTPKGSASDNRITKINFSDVPELSEPVTRERARTPETATPNGAALSSKKAKVSSLQDHSAVQPRTAPDSHEAVAKPGLKDIKIVSAVKSGASVLDHDPVKVQSPWERFRQDYELNLGGFIFIVSDRLLPHDIFMMKRLEGPDAAKKARMLRRIRHKNFHTMLECFSFEGSCYPVFQHVPVSLAHVAKSPPYPTEFELAAALGQIVEGLAYLASCGLEHGSLSCSNILIDAGGDIKIAGQECCEKLASPGRSSSRDMRALSNITMELMQKYVKDDGAVGIDDYERWPSDCEAVDFLAMTTSATSVDQLLKHPLLQIGWEKTDLKWMVPLAAVSTHRGFKFHE